MDFADILKIHNLEPKSVRLVRHPGNQVYEKTNLENAKKILKKNAYWNSGMFFLTKQSIIYNFKKYQNKNFNHCLNSVNKSKFKNNIYNLNKNDFLKCKTISFDYAILEKSKDINAINLDIPWSDLGNWKEICKVYDKLKAKYQKKKNIFYRPWGRYTNLYLSLIHI